MTDLELSGHVLPATPDDDTDRLAQLTAAWLARRECQSSLNRGRTQGTPLSLGPRPRSPAGLQQDPEPVPDSQRNTVSGSCALRSVIL